MCQQDLSQVLRQLPKFEDPNLIFGYDTVGDAGVYQLRDDLAIIQTVDILTPIADDPYTFGEIAAANSLSDVYVMGGTPVTALNIMGFPPQLDLSIMRDILKGASSKIKEAGAVILGGHTIKDDQLKYGLAITATIDPRKLITNDRAKPGDKLILTKPIGTGVISTALKKGVASEKVVAEANDAMRSLNGLASEMMNEVGVNACTDITGFGLLGHALQLAQASGVSFNINSHAVPFLSDALIYAKKGFFPGGSKKNYEFVKPDVHFDPSLSSHQQMLLCDAQTSGGLLIACPSEKSNTLVKRLLDTGVSSTRIIGDVIKKNDYVLYVT